MQLNMGGTDLIQRAVTPPYSSCSAKPHEGHMTQYTELTSKRLGEKKIKRKVSSRRTELMSVRIVLKFQCLGVILIKIHCMLCVKEF